MCLLVPCFLKDQAMELVHIILWQIKFVHPRDRLGRTITYSPFSPDSSPGYSIQLLGMQGKAFTTRLGCVLADGTLL